MRNILIIDIEDNRRKVIYEQIFSVLVKEPSLQFVFQIKTEGVQSEKHIVKKDTPGWAYFDKQTKAANWAGIRPQDVHPIANTLLILCHYSDRQYCATDFIKSIPTSIPVILFGGSKLGKEEVQKDVGRFDEMLYVFPEDLGEQNVTQKFHIEYFLKEWSEEYAREPEGIPPFDVLETGITLLRMECWLEFAERLYLNAFVKETDTKKKEIHPKLKDSLERLGRAINRENDTTEKTLWSEIEHHWRLITQDPTQSAMKKMVESLEWLSRKERESMFRNLEDYL